ncbi:MAG: MBOAT family protein [Candidatus Omnitrophica bacterium]|nr:MBOAT family protein [Candidatus Omnitrophota bacterium]
MEFNSFAYLVLLISTFAIYYLPFLRQIQIWILILASGFFYAYHNPYLILLLIFSVLINSWLGFKIGSTAKNRKQVHVYFIAGIVLNLSLLTFFKYSGFLVKTFFPSLSHSNSFFHLLMSVPLPIGISFFTFEGVSLLVDTLKDSKSLSLDGQGIRGYFKKVALFIGFFPHLISGPVLRAKNFFPQVSEKRLCAIDWEFAFRSLVKGYFFKMVIADNLKQHTVEMGNIFKLNNTFSSMDLTLLLLAYSIQIFSDFEGYSQIAIGTASLFGYRLPQNFNFPYVAKSIADFWHRWHISLSTWLRDYLYFPLGGNRQGGFRTYVNLFIVMLLGGLWHGADWKYVVWGAYHGGGLIIERYFKDHIRFKECWGFNVLSIVGVFVFVSVGWLIFSLPHLNYFFIYIKALFMNVSKQSNYRWFCLILVYSIPVLLYHLRSLLDLQWTIAMRQWDWIVYSFLLFAIFTSSGSSSTFIYFQF